MDSDNIVQWRNRYKREILQKHRFDQPNDVLWTMKGWDVILATSARYPNDLRLILKHTDDDGKTTIEQTRRFNKRYPTKALEYADALIGLVRTYPRINADAVDTATASVEKQFDLMPLQMVA